MRFSKLFSIIIAASALLVSCSKSDKISVLIGTYTVGTSSEGIYAYTFDQEKGCFTSAEPDGIFEMQNPSYLCRRGDKVYAVSEMGDSTANVVSLKFDAATKSFAKTGCALTEGADPCYIATNGRILLSGNYSGGSVSVFKLAEDGRIQGDSPSQVLCGAIGGPDTLRQCVAHVHCTIFTPDSSMVAASDFSADRVLLFSLQNDSLVPASIAPLDCDYGPRHIIFARPDLAYVIGELSGNVTAMRYSDGRFQPFQVVESDPAHTRASADIRISPDGKFLYASNRRGKDGVAVFSIAEDGSLAQTSYCPTAANPRNIAITPNGKFLLAGCQDDGVVQVFRRDPKTGALAHCGDDLKLEKAVCIAF